LSVASLMTTLAMVSSVTLALWGKVVRKYFLIGDGGHAKSVSDAVWSVSKRVKIITVDPSEIDTVEKSRDFFSRENRNFEILVGIGSKKYRSPIVEILTNLFPRDLFPPVIHKTAYISRSANIGFGSVLLANAYVGPDARIGDFCIANTGSIAEHEVSIGNFTILSPSVVIAGKSKIGENCFIGMNASIAQDVVLGHECTVGASSFVNHSFPPYSKIFGVPGKDVAK
jgi:acetyltransferase EpsM